MESFTRVAFISMLIVSLISCESELPQKELRELTDTEKLLTKFRWRYVYISANGLRCEQLSETGEPLCGRISDTGDIIGRKGIEYSADFTYQLRWEDRGAYSLGIEPYNYQPSFGFWQLSEDGKTLIHNPNTEHETVYSIEINNEGTSFTRFSQRIAGPYIPPITANRLWAPDWNIGDTLAITESFSPW